MNQGQYGKQWIDKQLRMHNQVELSCPFENVFKAINCKRHKVEQMKKIERSKTNLYWILSEKLEKQLRQITNHHTLEARQKHFLFQKCRNQRHIRRKIINDPKQTQQRLYNSAKSSLYRPATCCSRSFKTKQSQQARLKSKSRKQNKRVNQLESQTLQKKLQQIKNVCARQNSRSQEIREHINTAYFYQKLVNKNSSLIFNKML